MRSKDTAKIAQVVNQESGAITKLRFPAFQQSDAWKRTSIGTIAEVLPGYGFPEIYQGKSKGEYPFYKVSDISNSLNQGLPYISKAANYVDAKTVRELKAKVIPAGTTVFARIGEAIRSNRRAITLSPCIIDNNVAGVKRIEGKAVDLFMYYLLSTIDLGQYSGGVVPSVNKSVIESIAVLCPALLEQEKIAECLSSVDELIAGEGRKLSALKAYKKGLLQQLFPAEGETIPRLRFPEFCEAGEWHSSRLGEVFEISSGGTPDRSNKEYWNGTVPWITTSLLNNGHITYAEEYISEEGLRNSSAKTFPCGTVLIAMYGQGKTRGKVSILDCEAATNQACAAILPNKKILPDFVFMNLGNRYEELRSLSNPGGQENLSQTLIKELELRYPADVTEQKKITACVSMLDEQTSAQVRRIELLKSYKKGLMQQLFPALDEVQV